MPRYGVDTVELAIETLKQGACQQMKAKIIAIPDGDYRSITIVDSDGVVDEPLGINLLIRRRGEILEFDLSKSNPPCRGPNCIEIQQGGRTFVPVHLSRTRIFNFAEVM
jgi:N-methylhydantoinase B